MLDRREITHNIDLLLSTLPPRLAEPLATHEQKDQVIEIVMDLGRLPEARFRHDQSSFLSETEVGREDLDYVTERIGQFGEDNRAGIQRTLHRISAIRNRSGVVIGLTCRVGRAVYGTIEIVRDLVEAGKSILILGKPGTGKTTMLREVARVLADDFLKRVVIVDTSNEIAGDGDIPHPGIGRARRMQVARPAEQHNVMIEAVENHMPQVIVIDEIGTELEAQAARTIAERGVQLVGTAHGNTLENLMLNPTLSDLIGGIQAVTLGDEEARRRGTQKTVLERKAPPTFDVLVEIQSWDDVTIYQEVASAVDSILQGNEPSAEQRTKDEQGHVEVHEGRPERADSEASTMLTRRGGYRSRERERDRDHGERDWRRKSERREAQREERERYAMTMASPSANLKTEEPSVVIKKPGKNAPARIFAFGVSRNRLEKALDRLGITASLVREMDQATMVITLKNYYRQHPTRLRDAEERGIPVYVLRSNTQTQMEECLGSAFEISVTPSDPLSEAMEEVEEAISQVMDGSTESIELSPQSSYVRRLQHQIVERYNLQSESTGKEPRRRIRIFR
ncbi:R3H domain-containing nucleic acid-binding protein [Herpetosiphon giganteus]|uniref:R3H domain-containing nucleic acid-binding protein n=1 Tax=Herpetosiphon giganteus TaxID=2029754 RepID=UPI00195B5D56|nr:R3H domain-containing nucleic acid-binding protein [Herpetosiphon giganteus]MBM7843890.1 stage III sporulation protein SpoIIIAA [Herpetosiphon giganteus]